MTPQEIIDEARIPGTQTVLVLGSFEKRVTVYAQQVRALNLVDAIISENLVRPNGGKIAIIGGGAAGITAAVALARTLPELGQLDLFERNSRVLSLQHGSRRYLHPHFYDWPTPGAENGDAGLPIMNWTAGPASSVAEALRREFDAVLHSSVLSLHTGQAVTGLRPTPIGPIRVIVDKGSAISRIYDLVILAIGFGLEAHLDGETPSYWSPSELAGQIHTQAIDPILFVSGNGDGGLVDFIMAGFNALEHHDICTMLMGLDLGAARAEIVAIEQEAWADGADVDLLAAYRARLRPLIPAEVWHEIAGHLRPGARIHFHTRDPRMLRRTSALHNRLAAFLLLEADRELGNDAIKVMTGVEFDGDIPKRGEVRIVGQPPFSPLRRFLRLGADGANNIAPFKALLGTFPGALNLPRSAIRPESPSINASAQARFAALPALNLPQPVVVAPMQGGQTLVINLTRNPAGDIVWSGDGGPDVIATVWSAPHSISIHCDVAAADAAALAPALARLGAHATGFVLYARDAQGWRGSLSALCASNVLPGPDLAMSCPVNEWQPSTAVGAQITLPIEELASRVHQRLNSEALRQLHAALYDILGPAALQMGWPIEPALRESLWQRWTEWQGQLSADPSLCHRFLRLLTSEDDQAPASDATLVGLGPKTLRPYMTKPTIFALAFATCSGFPVVPTNAHPGNLASNELTGHSCGVGWINARVLGSRAVLEQNWTVGVVLLSQLQTAARMMEGDLRMDRSFDDPGAVGVIAPGEEPLIIGADDGFVTALGAGALEVRGYLQSIFSWRNATAQAIMGTAGQ
ncbi:ABC-three component system protein [Sinorhizobium fredii]|uniref:ABC-three component systems C-terminal domain-containing protein n=1 Tax=Rhizobium fredii TaxID=380 RepID=A0A2L0H9Z1_RHIFR|nr:ABC-three component system protein [Sinorhizobium fredii]AUX78316.1 hypothetical protein NXT3_PA00020 [Sinorhizobium fredii]